MQFKEETISTTIKTYPRITFDASMTEVSLDEFRGNPLLLLNFLINQGFVGMVSKEYDKFVKLCTIAPLQIIRQKSSSHPIWHYAPVISEPEKYKKNLMEYITQFDTLVKNIKVIDKIRLIRLLDMGLVSSSINDYFVLKLLHRLQEQWARFEIILSTRALEFIEAREMFKDQNNRLILNRVPNCEDCHSTQALNNCFALNILKTSTTLEMYDQVYKNHLKLLSYTMAVERNELCIFSHAKIGLAHIELLAKLFKKNYLAQSVGDLATTIDAINEAFASRLKQNKVHTCYKSEMLNQDYNLCSSSESAFADFIWGRKVPDQYLKPITLNVQFIHTQEKDKCALLKDGPYIIYTTNSQNKTQQSQLSKQTNQLFTKPKGSCVINISSDNKCDKSVTNRRSPNNFSPFCMFELEDIKSEAKTSGTTPNTREFKHG